jgi:hypothetical protein
MTHIRDPKQRVATKKGTLFCRFTNLRASPNFLTINLEKKLNLLEGHLIRLIDIKNTLRQKRSENLHSTFICLQQAKRIIPGAIQILCDTFMTPTCGIFTLKSDCF